jgi:F0F1-type ATP synthase assembly protein I
MEHPEHDSPLTRALKAFQGHVSSVGPAAAAGYGLVGAIVVLGAIGYALDARYGTSPALAVTGLLLGVAVGLYQLAKTLWRR